MGGHKKPGPTCLTDHPGIDEGTLCRARSITPAPAGLLPVPAAGIGEALDWLIETGKWLIGEKKAGAAAPPAKPEVSGAAWVARFPTSSKIEDLAEPFRAHVDQFVSALRSAGAKVAIHATVRPPQRAYLMHYSFAIAHDKEDPRKVPPMKGVNIVWVHSDARGSLDLKASRAAAAEMVKGYDIAFRPALTSRHSEGKAIDMSISWSGDLSIAKGNGAKVTISSLPRTGTGNTDLHHVGLSYGVHKLVSDPPHWSLDGH